MTSSATEAQTITFTVPLPPTALRSNSRAHWRAKVAAKQEYSRAVWECFTLWRSEVDTRRYLRRIVTHQMVARTGVNGGPEVIFLPWKAAEVRYVWRYCGVAPDRGNLGSNLKTLQDIICRAPNTGKLTENNTTYLGLVEDDKHILPIYELEKVSRRAEECVLIEIRRIE